LNFSVLTDEWIPVRDKNGVVRELSLAEVLLKAPDILELSDPSPLGQETQIRLLLAVLYRALDIKSKHDWMRLYEAKQFPADKLTAYFENWKDRFFLFGDKPLFQFKDFTTNKESALSKLAPEMVSGNNATLFDHREDNAGNAYSPAEAFRLLLVGQSRGVGGLLKASGVLGGKEFTHPSSTDGTIARGVTVWLSGDSLWETLMLNLVPPERHNPNDLPCWEQEINEKHFESDQPEGVCDRFTYLSRMICLIPEETDNGKVLVRRMYYTQGRAIARGGRDLMQCYKTDDKNGQRVVLLSETKATWRDLSALLEINQGGDGRAVALGFIGRLCNDEIIPKDRKFRLQITGMASDKAKILLWRHDRVNLPANYLENADFVVTLTEHLQKAEDWAWKEKTSLWSRTRTLCWHFLSPVKDMMSPDPKNVSALAEQLDPRRTYWARLETCLPELLERIPKGTADETAVWWNERIAESATEALKSAIERLGATPRAWRAQAAINPIFKI
jgi:CRISPR system Cascade subunit CasA